MLRVLGFMTELCELKVESDVFCLSGAAVAEGYQRSFSNLKVGSSIPSLPHLCAEVSLGKMLNPELSLIEQQRAANRCTV